MCSPKTCDFTINIWPTPVIEWAGEYPTNVINGVPVQMSTRVSGGDPNAWTYGWSLDGNQAGTQSTYTFTPANTQPNGSLQSTVALHAENAPADIDAPRGFDLNHTFTVWPTPGTRRTLAGEHNGILRHARYDGRYLQRWFCRGLDLHLDSRRRRGRFGNLAYRHSREQRFGNDYGSLPPYGRQRLRRHGSVPRDLRLHREHMARSADDMVGRYRNCACKRKNRRYDSQLSWR